MAKSKKGSHYEMVLEDRHLLGVFFAVVLLCAFFFTLGFVLGRNQARSRAGGSSPSQPAPVQQQPRPAGDLTFYDRVGSEKPRESAPSASQNAESEPPRVTQGSPPASSASPIYLQVAAFTQEEDAKRLAGELRQLGFPPRIQPPGEGRFYRVQVGPFDTMPLAEAAIRRLQAQGFRDIIVKR